MIRLVRLFQAKADVAFERFMQIRSREAADSYSDVPGIAQDGGPYSPMEAVRAWVEHETWAKAADILRKELQK